MKSCAVILCAFLCMVSITRGGGNYLYLEELKREFTALHVRTIQFTNGTDFSDPGQKALALLERYKGFMETIDAVEIYFLPKLFRNKCCWMPGAIKRYEVFRRMSRIYKAADISNNIVAFSTLPLIEPLQMFRAQARRGFATILNSASEEALENYSMFQLAYILYQSLTITELKLAVLASFGKNYRGNFSSVDFSNFLHSIMDNKSLTHDIWRRDPKQHIKGKTYLEIEQYAQGIVIDTVSISGIGTRCRGNCPDYKNAKLTFNCRGSKYCMKSSMMCTGTIDNCEELEENTSLCIDKEPRLYKYAKGASTSFGDKTTCPKEDYYQLLEPKCKFCVCTCYQKKDSAKYFSMRAALSALEKNRVVTGVRFYSHSKLIHIQVQEGTLGKNGTIHGKTSWVPVKHFSIRDRRILKAQDYFEINRNDRGVNLNDWVPSEETKHLIVTGVRFRKLGTRLTLQLQLTRFDFATGALHPSSTFWQDTITNYGNRKGIEIDDADLPTKCEINSTVVPALSRYVNFDHTSFKWDFAQTTVPFIDSQMVAPKIPGPLQGVGLYYKKQKTKSKQYGGFIGLKVFTYDFRRHLKDSK